MKSAFECFQEAARCEQKAALAPSEADRLFLLDAARHWKQRGEAAATAETAKPAARPDKSAH